MRFTNFCKLLFQCHNSNNPGMCILSVFHPQLHFWLLFHQYIVLNLFQLNHIRHILWRNSTNLLFFDEKLIFLLLLYFKKKNNILLLLKWRKIEQKKGSNWLSFLKTIFFFLKLSGFIYCRGDKLQIRPLIDYLNSNPLRL